MGGGGAKSYDVEKAWSSTNHSILSVLRRPFVQAAHAVIQLQETGKPVYKVKNVSLNALCELYDAPVNPMKEQVLIMTLF